MPQINPENRFRAKGVAFDLRPEGSSTKQFTIKISDATTSTEPLLTPSEFLTKMELLFSNFQLL